MGKTVFLIGSRGSGKSTVGRAVARSLGYAFADTDRCLQQKHALTIAEIVEKDGWEIFRQYEYEVLREVSRPDTVVSTGGGIVLQPDNCSFMRENGIVVYLDVPAELLTARLLHAENSATRPSLTGRPAAEEVQSVLESRKLLYEQTAHLHVDASDSPPAVADNVIRSLSL